MFYYNLQYFSSTTLTSKNSFNKLHRGPVIMRFKAWCFELIFWDLPLFWFLTGEEFLVIVWDQCQSSIVRIRVLIYSSNPGLETQQQLGIWYADYTSPLNCLDVCSLCLLTSECEVRSCLASPGPQWAIALRLYINFNSCIYVKSVPKA